ncbi:MAG: amidohydrolase [Oscillospiraceae bacterium]|nr:amidohydrolase [Oscillospiraceae bacterium]
MSENKKVAFDAIDSVSQDICNLGDAIWDNPETAFLETESTRLQCELLESLGFEVQTNLAGIPTAFSGRYGSGKPVIGILGEFDALSGMSQQANTVEKQPICDGANGHGCGHNLLGAGSVAAAYGIMQYLKQTGKSGTVIYFGCPGEEGGSGKAFMARDGVFDELDVALTWHPGDNNTAWYESTLANFQINYKFAGRASHAAAVPHLGRSALDAVELMNVGVQFLREHVKEDVRMHYAITNAGGTSPNVVQANAEVLYLIRAAKLPDVAEVAERVNNIARGAALMTDTKLEIEFIKACSNFVMNNVLADVLQENLLQVDLPAYTEQELAYAQSFRDTMEKNTNTIAALARKLPKEQAEWVMAQPLEPVCNFVIPRIYAESVLPGSTDVGDVSWVCPTAQLSAASWVTGTPAHSWQAVAQGKGPIAHKSTIYAGKVLAATAIDLLNAPEKIEAAKKEHFDRLEGKQYVPPIPKDVKPRAIGKKK